MSESSLENAARGKQGINSFDFCHIGIPVEQISSFSAKQPSRKNVSLEGGELLWKGDHDMKQIEGFFCQKMFAVKAFLTNMF